MCVNIAKKVYFCVYSVPFTVEVDMVIHLNYIVWVV